MSTAISFYVPLLSQVAPYYFPTTNETNTEQRVRPRRTACQHAWHYIGMRRHPADNSVYRPSVIPEIERDYGYSDISQITRWTLLGQPFSRRKMLDQLQRMKANKALGMDGVCTGHLLHLELLAQDALLRLFNMPWHSAEVPSVWRRAVIIPIPKAGKDPQDVSDYRPISLTSHVAKLLERMVAARVTHLLDCDNTMPAEQVGFRRGRSVENLGRMIQGVQDRLNCPAPRCHLINGKTVARYVLTAFDFFKAYDMIAHQMLRLKMLQWLPRCITSWIFHFLRGCRACAGVKGVRSSVRPFHADLPQGSMLASTMFTL